MKKMNNKNSLRSLPEGKVIEASFGKKDKEDAEFEEFLFRVRTSVDKIDKLMKELRETK